MYILTSFDTAVAKYRALEALKYFSPGPIMTFQGEENLDMTKFNFFREFESIKDERYLYLEKGYPNGKPAFEESIIGRIEYSANGKKRMVGFEYLIKDLNDFKTKNPSATTGQVITSHTIQHYHNPALALHVQDKVTKNETYILSTD